MKNLILTLAIVFTVSTTAVIYGEKCPEHTGSSLTFTGKTKIGTSGKLLKEYKCNWGEKYWIVSR